MEETFKGRLRNEIIGAGMSQPKFSRRMDITQQACSGWLAGQYQPRAFQLRKMAEIFDVSIEYLLGMIDERVTYSEILSLAEKKDKKRESSRKS
jgi:hypothetical protein